MRSVRSLRDLSCIRLLNYKEVVAAKNTELDEIRVQLEFRPVITMNPYKGEEASGLQVDNK